MADWHLYRVTIRAFDRPTATYRIVTDRGQIQRAEPFEALVELARADACHVIAASPVALPPRPSRISQYWVDFAGQTTSHPKGAWAPDPTVVLPTAATLPGARSGRSRHHGGSERSDGR